jgi:Pyridine nucleotide-disulphide oxidoreductase
MPVSVYAAGTHSVRPLLIHFLAGTSYGKTESCLFQNKIDTPAPRRLVSPGLPNTVVIVGGGAAGNAAAEMLRNEGFGGKVTLLSADESGPYDRPNLSKDY